MAMMKTRILLCLNQMLDMYSGFFETVKYRIADEYGLPSTWMAKHVVVIYYTEQETSLVEYTDDVKERHKMLL